MGSLWGLARHRLRHVLHYRDNIEELREQTKTLGASRNRLQRKVEAAERNGEIIETGVRDWIAEVDKITAEAKIVLEDEAKAKMCLNIRSRYKLSKEATKKAFKIFQLQEEGKFDNVSHLAPPPPVSFPSSTASHNDSESEEGSSLEFSDTLESRQSIMKEIVRSLKDDNVSTIGIYGIGGVGKTTMVKEIGKQAKERKLYDAVVMAVVTKTPSILNIQGNIARMLGFKILNNNATSSRAHSLKKRIKEENKILVILDNIWGRIELDEIGIPFGSNHRGCKIILTSRSRNVCNEMVCQKTFSVESLPNQESWDLFKSIVGLDVEDSDINQFAKVIVADGWPIAIVTLARALKNKNKHLWSNAAEQLKMSSPTNIEGINESIVRALEFSYNCLECEESKSMFLFCSLFPEDFQIPVEDLVHYGMGLRWFKDMTSMADVKVKTQNVVSTLISSFLLINDNECGEESVKMHDVVHVVALTLALKYNHTFMVKDGIRLTEWPSGDTFKDFTSISLISHDIREVPEELECPNLQSLLLQQNSKLVVPDKFFQRVKDLKILDLSRTWIFLMPKSLSLLVNLRTLYLKFCKLGDLSVIGELRNLEILSFFGSNVKVIPTSFNQLCNLRLLDLRQCRELTLISHGVLSCLHKLEELYMIKGFRHKNFQGSRKVFAKLDELRALSHLSSLQIFMPNPILLPDKMPFQNLSSFILEIGVQDDYWDADKYARNMMLSHMKIVDKFDWIKSLLKRSENLFFSEIPNFDTIFHDLAKEGMNELKSLAIKSCEVESLQNTTEWAGNLTFHNLEELRINKTPKLVEICHGPLPTDSFSKLKFLEVKWCNLIVTIVPSHLLQRLQNLETFKASACNSVLNIFDFEGLENVTGEAKLFSSLKDLELIMLPKMTHIWKGDIRFVSLHSLKRINLEHCQKLVKVFSPALLQTFGCLEKIEISYCSNLEDIFGTNDQATTSPNLGNLTYIAISYCKKLKNLFDPSIVKTLVNLRKLKLSHCSTIQEMVTSEGENGGSTSKIVFCSLLLVTETK
ncbi:disease resistance protein At4g27190-like [Pistacia vera]|uniref:disease resistance protein At4g27190-like n=1 Tax=Pistacia vera TaxID=55513 RepID=UPI0012635E18|nr:disease resistance protein At4g27190-like [Pistacia vera]